VIEVLIDNRSDQKLPLERIADLASFVFAREMTTQEHKNTAEKDVAYELSLSFVGIAEITELNSAYRGKAVATDVLSFELDDPFAQPPDPTTDPATGLATGPAKERRLLGDIVIQPDIARERAVVEEVGFEEELWILVIHGMLHLLGYDHATEEDALQMEALEDEHFRQWELSLNAHRS
jgi:probable rRNA maturation factor